MNILLFYNNNYALEMADMLVGLGHNVELFSKEISKNFLKEQYDLIISYTYRFIIKKEVIDLYKYKIVNIHNSFFTI